MTVIPLDNVTMSYRFDSRLIPNVLSDHSFQSSGIYIGQDQALVYAVIDPRRHTINVWTERQGGGALHQMTHGGLHYQPTATSLGSHFFTNGPQMDPPIGHNRFAQLVFALVPFQWRPYGRVISGSRILHAGTGNDKSFFGRTGAGHFTDYVITSGRAVGIEAIGGLVRIVARGGVVTSGDTQSLGQAIGICAWGLCPIAPVPTDGWVTEVPYIDKDTGKALDGLIVVAGSNQGGYNAWLATAMLGVGVKEAVATDGSDSVIMGWGNTLKIPCSTIKDEIQRWGFCCGVSTPPTPPADPCPTVAHRSGSSRRSSRYYNSRASANAAAQRVADAAAKVEAGLVRNAYRCPNVNCQQKRLRNVNAKVTKVSTSLAWVRWIFDLFRSRRYVLEVEFDWTADIECSRR